MTFPAAARGLSPRSFLAGIGALPLLALALRLVSAHYAPFVATGGDPSWYHLLANRIADGDGFTLIRPGSPVL